MIIIFLWNGSTKIVGKCGQFMDVFHAQDRFGVRWQLYWVRVGYKGEVTILAFAMVSCAVQRYGNGVGNGGDDGGNGGSIFLVATVIIDVDLKLLTFCCSLSTIFFNPIMIIIIVIIIIKHLHY